MDLIMNDMGSLDTESVANVVNHLKSFKKENNEFN